MADASGKQVTSTDIFIALGTAALLIGVVSFIVVSNLFFERQKVLTF